MPNSLMSSRLPDLPQQFIQGRANQSTIAPRTRDPVAETFLDDSIDELAKVFTEPVRLSRFADAVRNAGVMKSPAAADDTILVALDTLTFHLKQVEGQQEFYRRCLDAFKAVKPDQTASLNQWYDDLEEIALSIRGHVIQSKDARKHFENRLRLDIQSMRQRRLKFLARETFDFGIRRNRFEGDLEGNIHSYNKATGGARLRSNIEDSEFGKVKSDIGTGNESSIQVVKTVVHTWSTRKSASRS